jgi:hypothetical protein
VGVEGEHYEAAFNMKHKHTHTLLNNSNRIFTECRTGGQRFSELISTDHVRTSCRRAGSFMRVAVSAAFLYSESSIYSSKRSSASVILSMYFSASLNGSLYLLYSVYAMKVNVCQSVRR